MGNGYNQHLQHKTTFLPMLCSRPSIKDVALPKWQDRSASFSDDPLSPKISCMGQVKRNNKIIGFPAISHKLTLTTAKSNANNNTTVKYFKLKKLFSGKNLTSISIPPSTTTTTTTTTCCAATASRRSEVSVSSAKGAPRNDDVKENSVSISIDELDPPLPVIKREPKQGDKGDGDSTTLWQRRSGGLALKNLQLQQIQLNKHPLEPTTV